jgi:hypothetical protein
MAVAVLAAVADACNGFRVGLQPLSSTAWAAAGCSQVLSSCRSDASNGCSWFVPTPVMTVARLSAACRADACNGDQSVTTVDAVLLYGDVQDAMSMVFSVTVVNGSNGCVLSN